MGGPAGAIRPGLSLFGDTTKNVVHQRVNEFICQGLIRQQQPVIAGTPQLIHHRLGVQVCMQLTAFFRRLHGCYGLCPTRSRIPLQISSFQLRIGLSLADQLPDHRARRTVADDSQERMQLRAQVAFDVAGVWENQLGVEPVEIAVEREGAFGGHHL